MKIAVVSDTHGNIEYLIELAEYLTKNDTHILIFLGDECEDIEHIKHLFTEIIWVPGVYCRHYKDKNIPHRIIKNLNGVRFLITHTPTSHPNDFPEDIKPENVTKKEVDIVLYGHTHIPNIETKSGVIWVNPGHLKKEDNKTPYQSFAILDFNNRSIKITEFLSKTELMSTTF